MPPKINCVRDLSGACNFVDSEENVHSQFWVFTPNGSAYIGRGAVPTQFLHAEGITTVLEHIPDEHIYPKMLEGNRLRLAPEVLPENIYIKRPRLHEYYELKMLRVLRPTAFEPIYGSMIEEALNIERISKLPPHPGLLRYYGCIVNRGYLTGFVYDKHVNNVEHYIVLGQKPQIDKHDFMRKLISAVAHLHAAGFAHNDINPSNVLVDRQGHPILADFDSCCPIGEKLQYRSGTTGWIENDDHGNYNTSDALHDLYALKKMRRWLDWILEKESGPPKPVFGAVVKM